MRPDSAPLFKKPRTETEKKIFEIWSKTLNNIDIGIDDNFFDIGATSLLIEQVAAELNPMFKIGDSNIRIYQFPTIALLAEEINPTKNKTNSPSVSSKKKKKKSKKKSKFKRDIAIIGMAGKFPGAKTIDELWKVLKEGRETISFFKHDELDSSIPDNLKNNPQYVKARGIVPSVKEFDARFFEINQKLAEVMDPQIRLFLEICYEVLEENGYLPEHFKGSVGVYAGNGANSYYRDNILTNKDLINQVGQSQARTVNEEFIATRTAYHLNLNGPAVTIQSACSTSLLAISEAVEALRNGHCDVALAGASSVTAPINSGHLYQEGAIFSPDGHCRPFDSQAKGTVFSDGAGVVLLKSLASAKKDGDFIHGIIKGVGINNDGGNKGSFSAPSSQGQAGAISKALKDAKVKPSKISYIEAHGTATPVGDPIEIKGLNLAFGKQNKTGYCAVGSIKSNLGHLTAASGVAGLIKTVLAMKHKQIPASLGFNSPNPSIDFKNSPFYINNKLNSWSNTNSRIAGVSSFGVGGTNVHVIVEEYKNHKKESQKSRPFQILPWSAKTKESLFNYRINLANFIEASPETNIADIAYSLSKTRASFNNRGFIVIDKNTSELNKSFNENIKTSTLKSAPSDTVFLFPGQGSQFLQMGKTFYDNEIVFRNAIDTCAELLKEDLGLDIRTIIYPDTNNTEAQETLKNTRFTQPALFITEYALSQLWLSWGIRPTMLCGHSIGEFVAAHLANIFSLEDALSLIVTRGRLISELPEGSMLSVKIPEEQLKEILPSTLSIAAVNSKQLCVVSGENKDINAFAETLKSKNILHKILVTSHAFHSSMMTPILDAFEKAVKKTKRNKPNTPIVSSATGARLTDNEATSTSYWVNHLRNTVKFAHAMDTVLELENPILIEVGPGKVLTTLAHQQEKDKTISAFPSLIFPKNEHNEYKTILECLGNLWLNGVTPNWDLFYGSEKRTKVSLPSYVFDRKTCWIEPLDSQQPVTSKPLSSNTALNSNKNETKTLVNEINISSKTAQLITTISGINYPPETYTKHFLELGLDSLTLTQVSLNLQSEFGLPISFRQLNEDLSTIERLADYLTKNLQEEKTVNPTNTNSTLANHSQNQDLDGSTPLKKLQTQTSTIITDISGVIYPQDSYSNHFLELGLDSLTLTQVALKLQKEFKVPISFRQLNEDLVTIDSLADYLHKTLNNNEYNNSNKIEKNINLAPANDTQINLEPKNENINNKKEFCIVSDKPPIPGARLGRDENGNPSWFIADSTKKGSYIKINL